MLGPTLLAAAALASGTVTFGGDFFVRERHEVQRLGPGPVVVNLEGSLCREGPSARKVNGRWRLCLHEQRTLDALKAAGVAAVVLANNHSTDGGPEGLARLEAALTKAGIAVIDEARPWCHKDDAGELCVAAVRYQDDEDDQARLEAFEAGLLRMLDTGARVVVVEHYETVVPEDAPNAEPPVALSYIPGPSQPAAVLGVGGHEARAIHAFLDDRPGGGGMPAPYFHDLGDLVVDCACSRGEVGMVVDVPTGPGAPLRARLVRAAHGRGKVGAPPAPDVLARRLLQSVASGSTAYVIDDHIELWRIKEGPSSQPASQPASRPRPRRKK